MHARKPKRANSRMPLQISLFLSLPLFSLARSSHDIRTGLTSRLGAGRAAMYNCFGINNSYTVESNYHMDRNVHRTSPIPALNSPGSNPRKTIGYSPTHWRCVGKALAVALLDLHGHNPYSRLPQSVFVNLIGLQKYLFNVIKQRRQSKVRKKKRVHADNIAAPPTDDCATQNELKNVNSNIHSKL